MRPWTERSTAATLGAAATVAGVVTWALAWSSYARWIAMAAILIGLPGLVRTIRPVFDAAWARRPWFAARAPELLPYAIVALVTVVAFWPVSVGVMPISYDHNHHYLATSILVHDLIPSGHLFGWTDRMGAGFPYGDVYATPVYLVTGFLHLVTFGAVSLQTSYALGVFGAWLVCALVVTAWTRRLTGGVVGPVLAASAFVLDPGASREGGWAYSMLYGVWPNQFATGLFYLGLLCLVRLSEVPTTRRLAIATMVLGAGLWAHPMNTIHYALLGPVVPLVALLGAAGSASEPRRGATPWVIVALGLGGVFGLGWIRHMLAAGASAQTSYSAPWVQLREVAAMALDGGPFGNQLAIVATLALLGVVHTIVLGGRFRALTMMLAVMLLLLGTMEILLPLDLGLWKKMPLLMYRRFTISLKPLWYVMAGVGAAVVAQGLRSALAGRLRVPTSRALQIALLVAVAPLASATVEALPSVIDGPAARVLTLRNAGIARELAAIQQTLEAEKRTHPTGPHRVLYWRDRYERGAYALVPVTDAGFGYITSHAAPAQVYKWLAKGTSTEVMRWLGVSFVITHRPRRPSGTTLLQSFDHFHIYRIDDATDEQPVEVIGQGKVRVQAWGARSRRLVLEGTNAETRILLGVSPYGKWSARQGGRRLKIEFSRRKLGFVFTEIGGVRDGPLVLTYQDTRRERLWFGLAMGVLALVVVGLVLRPRGLPTLALTVSDRTRRWLWLGGGVLGAAAVCGAFAFAYHVGRKGADKAWLKGEAPGTVVLSVLHRERPARHRYWPENVCVRAFDQDTRVGCTEETLRPRLSGAPAREKRLPSCLAFGVPATGKAEIAFDLPRDTRWLEGWLHAKGSIPTALIVETTTGAFASTPVGTQTFHLELAPGAARVSLVVDNRASRALPVCLELVALGKGAPPEVQGGPQ